jgi:hypothetical protein
MADQGLDLNTYLAKLEDERARLGIIIADVRRRLGLGEAELTETVSASDSYSATVVTGRVRSDEFFRMKVPEAIKRYLEIMKQPQTPKAIADGLKVGGVLSEAKHFYSNVFTALKRLRDSGDVVNTKRGAWALSEWYPNRPKAGNGKKPKGKARKKGSGTARKQSGKPAKAATDRGVVRYQTFIGEQLKVGKTMKEAAEMWRKQKGEG